MKNIRIKEAIDHFNENKRLASEKRMTGTLLASIILPDVSLSSAGQYISNWNNGMRMGTLKPEHVIGICDATQVDPNFLYDYPSMK